jgi:purine-nucleoside/S-methyl-5'-thioadenosine phosphorylase / adenosine deaminase
MATTSAKRNSTGRKQGASPKRKNKSSGWQLRRAGRLQVLTTTPLAALDWLVHGFSTRPGGTSELAFERNGKVIREEVLNLGFAEWDSRENVLENRNRFFSAHSAAKMRIVALRQIHSDIVHRVDDNPTGEPLQGDAHFTRERGVLLTVQTADCVPILIADPKRRAVAAIHAGWRGTLRRIAAKTLGRMQMEFGTDPVDVIAALGPGIGRCCYEVGPEVARDFQGQFPEAQEWFEAPPNFFSAAEDPNWLPWLTMRPPGHPTPDPRARLDLLAANRAILASAGISPDNILTSDFCTSCRTDLFFSYRRERTTGRQMAAIAIR